jgi:hypothetical protein
MSDLTAIVDRMRAALATNPELSIYASLPPPAVASGLADLPSGVVEVLAVTDGPRCGAIIWWSAAELPEFQFYCDEVGGEDDWLCFAVNNDDPIYVRRDSGEVWWWNTPDTERWVGGQFERLTDDVRTFFREYTFGSGYLQIAYDDQWYELLRAQGLVA